MPPSDPAAVCPCGSPNIDWTANGKLLCARCATNAVVASASFVTPAAVPPPDSHEPAGRVDVSGSAPEWAVEMARGIPLCGYDHDSGCCLETMDSVARLLASVREGALREAASAADHWSGWCAKDDKEVRAARCIANKIGDLLHTPPSGGAG